MNDDRVARVKIVQAFGSVQNLRSCSASAFNALHTTHQTEERRLVSWMFGQVLLDVSLFLPRAYKPSFFTRPIEVVAPKW